MKPYIIICVEKQLNSYVYRVIRIVGLVSKSGFRTVTLAQRNAVLRKNAFGTTHNGMHGVECTPYLLPQAVSMEGRLPTLKFP